jgi:serine/threonine-protein kinase
MKLCPKCGKHFSDDANFCPVDAARLTPLDGAGAVEQTDALSARFDLGERLGGATTGEVRKATDKQSGHGAVVKLISPQVMGLPQVAQRIERELKQLERVESASVAKVLASGKRGESAWVATEHVDGAQTLGQVLAARGPLAAAQAAELVATIGEALIEAAKVGVVHRDLAPKNVLLGNGDAARIKLINFCAPTPTSERAPGVPEYTAPEVIEGKQLDQRSNIYSLGAIYYHALTGSPPFSGEVQAVHASHLAGGAEPPSKRIAAPAELDALILRALERNPAKRYLTVRQFVDEVQRVARGDASGTQRLGGSGQGKQKPKEAIQTLMGVPPADGKSGPVIELTPKAPVMPAPPVVPSTMAGVAPPSPSSIPPPSQAPTVPTPAVLAGPGSPWAPPQDGGGAFAPAVAAQAAAAPGVGAVAAQVPTVMTAPPVVPAAPVMPPAPVVPAATKPPAAGGKGKASSPPEDKGSKGKFRETMWFKKGDLDAAAAEAAAEEAARTGKASVADKADSLPMEERYKDDGTINRQDRDKYSLKTGDTTMMPAVKAPDELGGSKNVSADELVGEMKGGRNLTLLLIFIGLAAIVGVVVYFATR